MLRYLKVKVENMLIFLVTSQVVPVFNCEKIKFPFVTVIARLVVVGKNVEPPAWVVVVVVESGWHVVTGVVAQLTPGSCDGDEL